VINRELSTPTSTTLPPGLASVEHLLHVGHGASSLFGSLTFTIGGGATAGSFVGLAGTGSTGVWSGPLTHHSLGSDVTVGGSASNPFDFSSKASGGGIFSVGHFLGTGGVTGGALTTLHSLMNANLTFGGAGVDVHNAGLINPLLGGHHNGGLG
jgi:hypothetical protein